MIDTYPPRDSQWAGDAAFGFDANAYDAGNFAPAPAVAAPSGFAPAVPPPRAEAPAPATDSTSTTPPIANQKPASPPAPAVRTTPQTPPQTETAGTATAPAVPPTFAAFTDMQKEMQQQMRQQMELAQQQMAQQMAQLEASFAAQLRSQAPPADDADVNQAEEWSWTYEGKYDFLHGKQTACAHSTVWNDVFGKGTLIARRPGEMLIEFMNDSFRWCTNGHVYCGAPVDGDETPADGAAPVDGAGADAPAAADDDQDGVVEMHVVEMRIAPDGNSYTRADFEDYYGGSDEWHQAPPASPARPVKSRTARATVGLAAGRSRRAPPRSPIHKTSSPRASPKKSNM